jgi:antirestriction protein ArdC
MTKRLTNAEIREQVTADIIEALKQGCRPWAKPWTSTVAGSPMPHNCISGHEYQGINVLWLSAQAFNKGYASQQWLTFNQARKAGGHVRKGEKGCKIIFTKPLVIRDKDGNAETDSKGRDKVIHMLRVSTVFNIEQTEDVKLPKREQPVEREPLTEDDAIRTAKAMLEDAGADVRYGGSRAFYSPADDFIGLPNVEDFNSGAGFAATALHELTHWTGHSIRNDRKLVGAFGSEAYAYEELVAELGANMLCTKVGIENEVEHHASYIESWIAKLENDHNFIFKASKLAQDAVETICGKEETNQQEAA